MPLVPGLRYLPDYLDSATHDDLLAAVDSHPWHVTAGRGVQLYGYGYHHAQGGIHRIGDLPIWAADLAGRLQRDGLTPHLADQMVANDYPPGSGLFDHVDAPVFDDTIVSISLGSTCVMQFTERKTGRSATLLLEPRSALVLAGEARSTWTHAIPARRADHWRSRELVRRRRISLSFRRMLQTSGPVAVGTRGATTS